MAGSGSLEYGYIAYFVNFGLEAVLFCKIKQELTYALLFLRGTGHFGYLVKDFKNSFRIKIFYFHISSICGLKYTVIKEWAAG